MRKEDGRVLGVPAGIAPLVYCLFILNWSACMTGWVDNYRF